MVLRTNKLILSQDHGVMFILKELSEVCEGLVASKRASLRTIHKYSQLNSIHRGSFYYKKNNVIKKL